MLEYKRLEPSDIIYKDCNAMEVFNSIFNFGHSVNEDYGKISLSITSSFT